MTVESIVLAVKRCKFLHLSITLALPGSFATQAFAQEATIVGTVTDPSGAAVPNVTLTITHTETGQARQAVTNGDGQYLVSNLSIGHYSVRVDALGFKRIEQNNIVLQVGDRSRLDFKLEIGSTQEQVTVEANLPLAFKPIQARSATSLPVSRSQISRRMAEAFTTSSKSDHRFKQLAGRLPDANSGRWRWARQR